MTDRNFGIQQAFSDRIFDILISKKQLKIVGTCDGINDLIDRLKRTGMNVRFKRLDKMLYLIWIN